MCLETYSKLVSTLDPEAIQRKRGGTPAGNAAARPVNPDKVGLTAQYAFEIGQIDHYLADCFVVVAKTAKKIYCARPWVTLMIDTYSKCVIGLWVGLSAPSRKACAMVFRDCAKRHGRLPKCIRVDNGSDFQSVHFDALIAYLHLSKEHRPASDPRYGSEVERVFNTIRTQFLDDQLGHLRNNERNRAVANAFKGEAVAALDMEFFYQFLEKYIFDDYNAHLRTANTKAPCIVLQDSIDRLKIAGVEMVLDAKLMLATALDAPSKRYRLSYVDGIRVEQNRYRSSEMFAMLARGTSKAEIKLEPYDDTFIYVHDVDRECWHIATKISASLDLAPTDLRPDFDALMRREGKSILKGVKQDRDRYYVAKRKENLKVLKAAGIDFLDLTDQPKSEDSITQMTSPSRVSPDPTQLRSIEQFAGFA